MTGPSVVIPLAGLPVIGPGRQTCLVEAIRGVSPSDLVHSPVAENLGELTEDVGIVFFIAVGGRGVVHASGAERLEQRRVGHLPHQTHLRRQLIVQAHASQLHVRDALQLDIECRVRRLPDRGQGLALVFIVGEEVERVLHDRAAVRPADLLIRVGHDHAQHGIFRVEGAVPEVANKRSGKHVGTRLGDRVHLHAR